MADDLLTIGELASRTGRRTSSIRYYEEIGLLPEPVRRGGQRRYDAAAVRNLAVIDTAQRAGLALDEIKPLFAAGHGDVAAVEQLREIAVRKLPELVAMIERAALVRQWLEAAARCECPSLDDCGLFSDAALPEVAGGRDVAADRAVAAAPDVVARRAVAAGRAAAGGRDSRRSGVA